MSVGTGAAAHAHVAGSTTAHRVRERRVPPLRRTVLHLVRWLPAVVTTGLVVAVLHRYGTPVPVSLGYLGYLVLAVTLPGTLLWRLVRGRPVSFVEDVAVGTAVGLSVQVLLAFALAPMHLSTWSWVWAPCLVVASVAVRRWRARAWSQPGVATTSALSAWVQGLTVVAATLWLGATALASNPVGYVDGWGPWSRALPSSVYVDLPFHQAIAAGIDTHYPLVYPYLYDEPLRYHLFVYEHLAAAHTAGLDLTWLLYRVEPVALVALGIVLVGVLARRLAGTAWAAPLAGAVVALSSSANVYGWTAFGFQNPGLLHFAVFRSPTQTFGLPLFLAAVTAAVLLLRHRRLADRPGLLGVFTLLAWGAGGSKSTFLPVLVAALALVLVVALVLRSGALARVTAALLGISVTGFALLLLVVLGGQSGSLAVTPLTTTRAFAAAQLVADPESMRHTVLITALALAAWLCSAAGLVLLLRREVVRDPTFWLLLGVAGAGIGACLLTTANGLSQLYFLYASWPALGVLSVWGLTLAMRGWPRRCRPFVPVGLLIGAAVLWAVRRVDGLVPPDAAPAPAFPYRAMVGPWLLLLGAALTAAVLVAVLVTLTRRRHPSLPVRPVTAALVAASLVLTGAALLQRGTETARAAVSVLRDGQGPGEGYPVPRDGALAALYVRDHSAADAVVATNAHCYGPEDACDTRHFWVSALTERRVLVEGWAYPEGFRPGQTRTSPFWDTERYDANQAVFDDPDQVAVQRLADEWGVQWLVVDRTLGTESSELRRYATLVLESEGAAVYRIG